MSENAQVVYHLWFSGAQARVSNQRKGYTWYRLVETAEATERHRAAVLNNEAPEVAVTEASLEPTPSGNWDDYVYLGSGYWSRA